MCMLVVCFRTCCNSVGVWMFMGRFVWLWIQMIDVMMVRCIGNIWAILVWGRIVYCVV